MVTGSTWMMATVALAALVCGCAGDDTGDAPDTFIAFGSDFAGYHTWKSFTPALALPGNDHLSGPRTVYVNSCPSQVAPSFRSAPSSSRNRATATQRHGTCSPA